MRARSGGRQGPSRYSVITSTNSLQVRGSGVAIGDIVSGTVSCGKRSVGTV